MKTCPPRSPVSGLVSGLIIVGERRPLERAANFTFIALNGLSLRELRVAFFCQRGFLVFLVFTFIALNGLSFRELRVAFFGQHGFLVFRVLIFIAFNGLSLRELRVAFLGQRGFLVAPPPRHKKHPGSLLVSGFRVCGFGFRVSMPPLCGFPWFSMIFNAMFVS